MTVDNDVKDSEYTIGFDTALNRINQTVHDIHDTAYNMPGRIFMIEVLGGDCGNLALCSAVSSGSDLAIIPEYSTDKLKITKLIEEKLKIKDSVIIICSESSYDTSSYKTGQQGVSFEIGSYIEEKLNIRVRKTVMGFSIRSGSPTYRDAMISAQMGFFAKECILNNDEGIKICLINGEVKAKNYYENIEYSNENHLDKDIVKIAINNQVIIEDKYMLKVLMVCGAGLGSSFGMEMSVESVLKELGVKASLSHTDISSASGEQADIVIAAENFESQVKRYGMESELIFLNNLVDKKEIKEKLTPVLERENII